MKNSAILGLTAVLFASACQPAAEGTSQEVEDTVAETTEAPAGPPPMGDPADNPDMTAFAAEVDADGNGEMSRAEWEAKGLPDSSFSMFEQGRGFVTLEDYQVNAAPPGIDMDGDGVLTVEEFVEFDRQMSAAMPDAPSPAE